MSSTHDEPCMRPALTVLNLTHTYTTHLHTHTTRLHIHIHTHTDADADVPPHPCSYNPYHRLSVYFLTTRAATCHPAPAPIHRGARSPALFFFGVHDVGLDLALCIRFCPAARMASPCAHAHARSRGLAFRMYTYRYPFLLSIIGCFSVFAAHLNDRDS